MVDGEGEWFGVISFIVADETGNVSTVGEMAKDLKCPACEKRIVVG